MGLPVSVLLRGDGARDAPAAAAVQAVHDELRDVEAVFSTWRPDSEVSRLNRGDLSLNRCSPDVRTVARLCERARDETAGCFDAQRPEGGWDPSGLVKGWAVERAARHLADLPLDWCLNAGGDVLVSAPSGEPFGVGVVDAHDQSACVCVLRLTSGAVATSGTAARGSHLWDPRHGGPAGAFASVTVAGSSLLEVDVLATAVFVAGDLALLRGREVSGLGIRPDGRQEATGNWSGQSLKFTAAAADT